MRQKTREGATRGKIELAPARILIAAVLVALAALAAPAATAQSLIRDAEIEATLKRLAYPMIRAAGLNPATVRIYIINDREPNAFVAGGSNLFINTGLVTRLKTVDQLRAVMAHEIGHIAGGHLARRDAALGGARGIAAVGAAVAAAAALAGSPQAGLAIIAGSQNAALRTALAHSRAEEAAADQAGIRYLSAAGGDPEAALDVLRLFRGQEALLAGSQDAYTLTHPLWSERIALLEERVAKLPPPPEPDPEDVYWHARMVAKFKGFLNTPGQTLKAYPASDASEPAMLARAVAYYREPSLRRALASVDALIAVRPDDPYYHDLKGQFLLEAGQAGAAAQEYRRAVGLAPKDPLILGGLGRALLNVDDPAATREAAEILRRAEAADRANPEVLRDLALAEARLGNEGQAALATAERFTLEGRPNDAYRLATRASALLPTGSPGWNRAQDVLTMARRAVD
ncbi:M48 family metalloprotease [Amaricoccus sp.]|uniref:M48 family metalloprotease n=1 Tax=Amaricoccus sp. TaxID=1872485 RepID=UPI001B58E350|nr:M48 family metalloprotease [Amaricoccus sp.]MBP7001104.1 M48 family metalloprotease [Amaricoccus sp.]